MEIEMIGVPVIVVTWIMLLVIGDKMKRKWGENPPKFWRKR
jgi:hypothetical protein